MASTSKAGSAKRDHTLRTTRSFTPRNEAQDPAPAANRPQGARNFQNGALVTGPGASRPPSKTHQSPGAEAPDAFEKTDEDEEGSPEPPRASIDMEDLPIELISLTDSFIDSLSAKVHPTPPNVDNLSRLFQEFYISAASHINTHVSSLISRQSRDQSPITPSRASPASLLRAKAASIGSRDRSRTAVTTAKSDGEQQMITAEELADRKRTRKALEKKRGLLEEAVERRLCEGIYNRIYRHRSTQDEAQDDKLRSKTAALAVVGIGPSDLGVDLGPGPRPPEGKAERQEAVKKWLKQARRDLQLMNESRYPLGKLNRLKAAHKSIVDTLAHFHPSSSADEIMPMLIYTLITLPPENLSVVSDLNFIQRFRCEQKLIGEAAYCLTNLEAAISFLDTVDLSTLRPDEAPSGPTKSYGSGSSETSPPAYSQGGLAVPSRAQGAREPSVSASNTSSSVKPAPSPPAAASGIPSGLRAAMQLRNRRLSDLVNTPAQAFGAASDAVLTTADQGLKNISNSLGDSYKFLIGKLRERQDGASPGPGEAPLLVVPKTLDEARKLIGTPPPDDEGSVSGASSIYSREEPDGGGGGGRKTASREEKMLNLIGGRKTTRDHSADSDRSTGSSKRTPFPTSEDKPSAPSVTSSTSTTPVPPATGVPPASNAALMDSVRNFSNSLNPMSRLSGMGLRGFGRTATTPAAPTTMAKGSEGGDLASAFPDIAPALPPKQHPQISPPVKKFMEAQTAAELKIGDIGDLLRDYRRLAAALRDREAFKEL